MKKFTLLSKMRRSVELNILKGARISKLGGNSLKSV